MKPGCPKCFKVAEKNGNEYICPSRQLVTLVKIKKGVPTVIRVDGREYILRAEGQFNQRKKGAVK